MTKSGKQTAINRTRRQPSKRATKSTAPRRAARQTDGRPPSARLPASQKLRSAAPQQPRPSKQAEVIVMLRRPDGTTVAEVVSATGWQPHTVRGLFSGTLRKKLGLTLSSTQEERGRVYRIIDGDGTASAAAAEHSGTDAKARSGK
jgi:hypothetical protein